MAMTRAMMSKGSACRIRPERSAVVMAASLTAPRRSSSATRCPVGRRSSRAQVASRIRSGRNSTAGAQADELTGGGGEPEVALSPTPSRVVTEWPVMQVMRWLDS